MSLWEKLFNKSASEIPRITPEYVEPLRQGPSPQKQTTASPSPPKPIGPAPKTQSEGLAQRMRDLIERVSDDDFVCLKCGAVQSADAWLNEVRARGAVYISGEPECLKCRSKEMAGKRWSGFLLPHQEEAYENKLRSWDVKVKWLPEAPQTEPNTFEDLKPSTDCPMKEDDQLCILKDLCDAYTRNDNAQIKRLEPVATEIGRELDRRGGIAEMGRVYSLLGKIPGTRTLDMHWDGIGAWRG